MAIRRQADEILAKDEFKQKIAAAAHKYNLMQVVSKSRNRGDESSSDSDSDSD